MKPCGTLKMSRDDLLFSPVCSGEIARSRPRPPIGSLVPIRSFILRAACCVLRARANETSSEKSSAVLLRFARSFLDDLLVRVGFGSFHLPGAAT